MSFDVITIGSATVDQFASLDADIIRFESSRSQEEFMAFPLGGKVLIDSVTQMTGGGGTNTAVSFSRLGLKTGFLGKIGDDAYADYIVTRLQGEGVEFIGPRATCCSSGFSLIVTKAGRDRTIFTFKGANDTLKRSEVPEFKCQWIYSSSMMGDSFATIAALAQEGHAKFAFNPSSYQAKQGYEKLRGIIDHLTVLVLNKEEALELLGRNPGEKIAMPELFKAMAFMPPKYIVITNGSDGTHVWDRTTYLHARPAKDIKVLETTGAGDSLASGFVAGLAMGLDTLTALRMGMFNCESVISQVGAKAGLLTKDVVMEKIATDSREVLEQALSA